MAFVHGKNTVIKLNAVNLSAFTNQSYVGREADTHDGTCYGKNDHVFKGRLGAGTASMSGIYDDTTSGPRDVIEPLIGTNVPLIRQPEGAGTGKPQDSVDVVVRRYVETSPVADMVAWSAELQLSDAVTSTNQP